MQNKYSIGQRVEFIEITDSRMTFSLGVVQDIKDNLYIVKLGDGTIIKTEEKNLREDN